MVSRRVSLLCITNKSRIRTPEFYINPAVIFNPYFIHNIKSVCCIGNEIGGRVLDEKMRLDKYTHGMSE